ncbi:hypothetical protein INR49_026097 [Caranx melampygus]|nr:hypothetical protein INR49_026097 [Caranx melampygus]
MATPFLWKLSSQKLGFFLVSFGFIWGMMLLHFTIQQRASHENSAVLRQQILDLSKRYIKALAEENQSVMDGPYVGTMTAYATLQGQYPVSGESPCLQTGLGVVPASIAAVILSVLSGVEDLKKTLAVLLDNIMLRLGKLESKVENIYNGTGGNLTNSASTATPSATNAEKMMNSAQLRERGVGFSGTLVGRALGCLCSIEQSILLHPVPLFKASISAALTD